jgi:hypothetical protein
MEVGGFMCSACGGGGARAPSKDSAELVDELPVTPLSNHIEGNLLNGVGTDGFAHTEFLVREVHQGIKEFKREDLFSVCPELGTQTFKANTRCLILFQRFTSRITAKVQRKGVIKSFIIYVDEYTEGINAGRVMLCYLENVNSMPGWEGCGDEEEVKRVRRAVHHNVILGYLDFCRSSGFTYCHFFACTPLHPSLCYIFNHRPDRDTRVDQSKRQKSLNKYYNHLTKAAVAQGIARESTFAHKEVEAIIAKSRRNPFLDLYYLDNDFWDVLHSLKDHLRGNAGPRRSGVDPRLVAKGVLEIMRNKNASASSFYVIKLIPKATEAVAPSELRFKGDNSFLASPSLFMEHCQNERRQYNDVDRNMFSTYKMLQEMVMSSKEMEERDLESILFHCLRCDRRDCGLGEQCKNMKERLRTPCENMIRHHMAHCSCLADYRSCLVEPYSENSRKRKRE